MCMKEFETIMLKLQCPTFVVKNMTLQLKEENRFLRQSFMSLL